MIIQAYCDKLTKGTPALVGCDDEVAVPEKYVEPTKNLINIMKNKRDGFDRIEIPFIEMVLEQVKDISSVLEENLEDGEVPNGIIRELSLGIFKKTPSELTTAQASIIRVCAIYLCIQN